jgi:flagellar biosynthesis protein FlhF
MRLKTFTAATTAEAMRQIRNELGEDVIIISSRRAADGRNIDVVVALEEPDAAGVQQPVAFRPAAPRVREAVMQALVHHGLPAAMIDTLAETAAALVAPDATLALAGALDGKFTFDPLPGRPADAKDGCRVILVGPPGAGKTIAAAKLAARAVIDGRSVGVVSADGVRAGGIEQLAAFTRILKLDLVVAKTAAKLREAVFRLGHRDLVVVDTASVNPFERKDQAALKHLIEASAAEPVAVLPAGGDAAEMADMAGAFRALGARRMIATRLDAALRLGGVLAAAEAGPLAFAAVGDTHQVAGGLSAVNAASLARRLMQGSERLMMDDGGPGRRRAGAAS